MPEGLGAGFFVRRLSSVTVAKLIHRRGSSGLAAITEWIAFLAGTAGVFGPFQQGACRLHTQSYRTDTN